MKKSYQKIREYVPLFSIIVLFLTLISLIFFLLYSLIPPFADFFCKYMSLPFRAVLSYITSVFPFSLAEILIIAIPVWLSLLIFFGVKLVKAGKKEGAKYFSVLASVLLIVLMAYIWTYTSGFYNTKIEDKLELNRENITKEELYETSKIVVTELNKLAQDIEYDDTNASIMPYSYDEMSSKICDAYDKMLEKHDLFINFRTRIKPIMLSEPMTYTHISGVYTFFTGEANVNVNYPNYVMASSSAHEMAHQRGIAREDEASFVAFLALIASDDSFLRYSAYLDVFSYLSSALYSADYEMYKEIIGMLDTRVKLDRNSYSEFFKKYSNSPMAEVSDKVNDSYLQANGQVSGTKSYGMVTELLCAYLVRKK